MDSLCRLKLSAVLGEPSRSADQPPAVARELMVCCTVAPLLHGRIMRARAGLDAMPSGDPELRGIEMGADLETVDRGP